VLRRAAGEPATSCPLHPQDTVGGSLWSLSCFVGNCAGAIHIRPETLGLTRTSSKKKRVFLSRFADLTSLRQRPGRSKCAADTAVEVDNNDPELQ